MATIVHSRSCPQSAKGSVVAIRVDTGWCLTLMAWKKNSEPCGPRER
jgi:hypothetical protein